jgi:hypothetical protein
VRRKSDAKSLPDVNRFARFRAKRFWSAATRRRFGTRISAGRNVVQHPCFEKAMPGHRTPNSESFRETASRNGNGVPRIQDPWPNAGIPFDSPGFLRLFRA